MKYLRLSLIITIFLTPIYASASAINFTCDIFDIIDVKISGETLATGDVHNNETQVQLMDLFYIIQKENIIVNRINTSRGNYFEYLYKNPNAQSDDFLKIVSDEKGNAITNMLYKGIAFEDKKTYCRFEEL